MAVKRRRGRRESEGSRANEGSNGDKNSSIIQQTIQSTSAITSLSIHSLHCVPPRCNYQNSCSFFIQTPIHLLCADPGIRQWQPQVSPGVRDGLLRVSAVYSLLVQLTKSSSSHCRTSTDWSWDKKATNWSHEFSKRSNKSWNSSMLPDQLISHMPHTMTSYILTTQSGQQWPTRQPTRTRLWNRDCLFCGKRASGEMAYLMPIRKVFLWKPDRGDREIPPARLLADIKTRKRCCCCSAHQKKRIFCLFLTVRKSILQNKQGHLR